MDTSISCSSRRAFLGSTALSALTLFPEAAVGAEPAGAASPRLSNYSVPMWRHDMGIAELASKPIAISRRHESVPSGICCSTVHIDHKGDVYIRSFDNIRENGWFRNQIKERTAKPGKLINPVAGEPDIKPMRGSGAMLEYIVGGKKLRYFLSNDHVISAARREVEDLRCSIWKYDVNFFPVKDARVQDTDRERIPIGSICSDPKITNQTLQTKKVRLFGLGANLYEFVGHPFPIKVTIPVEGSKPEVIRAFGLRVQDGFFQPSGQFAGMSGSPVVLEGTQEIVGVAPRLFSQEWQGRMIQVVFFAPIDALRELQDRLLATITN